MALTPLNIAIQQPQHPSMIDEMYKMAQVKDAMQLMKQRTLANTQNEQARKIFAGSGSDEEVSSGLHSAGLIDPYTKWQEYIGSARTEHLKQANERITQVQGHIKLLHEAADGLRQVEDPSTRQILAQQTQKYLTEEAGVPQQLLFDASSDESLDHFIQMYKNTDAELKEQKSKVDKQIADLDLQTKTAAEARAKAEEGFKNQYERQGKTAAGEQAFTQYLNRNGVDPSTLNPQSEAQARHQFELETIAEKQKPTDTERFVELGVKIEKGDATPDEQKEYKQYEKRATMAGTNTFNLNNPTTDDATVAGIVREIEDDPTGTVFNKLTAGNKKLQDQVRKALIADGGHITINTASTRQLSETAHALMPKLDETIALLNDPKVAAKLGPVIGRWNEFKAGKIGAGDPDFIKIRTLLGLEQTGIARAHIGARGSQQLKEKFESLFNSDKMDANTLKVALETAQDFLRGYEQANPKYNRQANAAGAGERRVQMPDGTTHVYGADGKYLRTEPK